jgi:hypothetical protein
MSLRSVDPPPKNVGAVRIGQWAIIGIVTTLVAAMLVYDYTRPYWTMTNVAPSSHPSTTGAVPTSHKLDPARSP